MDKYVCLECGYEYEQVIGDPNGKITPGTEFVDIPDNWFCPVCGARKSEFEKI